MLGFLKRLFGKDVPETSSPVIIPLTQLEDWLRQARAPAHARFVEQLSTTRSMIDQHSIAIREKVQALQSAQLMNPDIPERAKHFMQGNREEYSRRVLQYLDGMIIPTAAEALPSFFMQHQQDATAFTRGILRPFQILQEFFSRETKEITALIAQTEQELIALQSLHEQSSISAHDTLHQHIPQLLIKQQQRNGLEHERIGLEQQQHNAEQSLRALNLEEERLLKDADRQQALTTVRETHQRVHAHEQKLRDLFANAQPALRKFYRMATHHVKLLEEYLRDPIATLIGDLHLDLLEIIADIQRLITFDRLPLGEHKEFVIDAVSLLTKEQLGTWLREYGQLTKTEKEAQHALDQCEASQTLARIQRLREETRRNQQLAEQRLAHVRKDLERIDLPGLTTALETRIKEVTGTAITIMRS